MATKPDEFRIDKSQFSVASLTDPDDSVAYWLTRPPIERLQALELLRRTIYCEAITDEPLQRVVEVVQLERR